MVQRSPAISPKPNADYKVTTFETAKACLTRMHLQPHSITVDFSLPHMSGDNPYCKIGERIRQLPVIVISRQEGVAVAVNLPKMDASDYMVNGDATKELLSSSANRPGENQSLKIELVYLRKEPGDKFSFEKTFVGQSEALKKVFILRSAAKSDPPLF